jgi:hypothetical protein
MRTDLLLDRNEKLIVAATTQDVEPILERNRALRGELQRSDWGRHVATIPNVVLVTWLIEQYAAGNTRLRIFSPEFNELVARKLEDPDWAYLRVDK